MSEIDRIVAKYLALHYRLVDPLTVSQCLDAALLEYGQIVREECAKEVDKRRGPIEIYNKNYPIFMDLAAAIRNANKG